LVYQSSPHRLRYTFTKDVRATLDPADLQVQTVPGGARVAAESVAYDVETNTATFTFAGALPNGNYRAVLVASGVTDAADRQLTANHVTDFFVLAGDVNRDRSVNGTDFALLAGNFGKTGMTYGQGDLNGDGNVNGTDFAILAGNFGKTVPAPAAAVALRPASAASVRVPSATNVPGKNVRRRSPLRRPIGTQARVS
jgi:hypothetical protein